MAATQGALLKISYIYNLRSLNVRAIPHHHHWQQQRHNHDRIILSHNVQTSSFKFCTRISQDWRKPPADLREKCEDYRELL